MKCVMYLIFVSDTDTYNNLLIFVITCSIELVMP